MSEKAQQYANSLIHQNKDALELPLQIGKVFWQSGFSDPAYVYFQLVETNALARGKYETLLEVLINLVKLKPLEQEYQLLLSNLYHHSGDSEKSINVLINFVNFLVGDRQLYTAYKVCELALSRDETNFFFLQMAAQLCLDLKKHKKSLAFSYVAYQQDPTNKHTLEIISKAFFVEKNYELAFEIANDLLNQVKKTDDKDQVLRLNEYIKKIKEESGLKLTFTVDDLLNKGARSSERKNENPTVYLSEEIRLRVEDLLSEAKLFLEENLVREAQKTVFEIFEIDPINFEAERLLLEIRKAELSSPMPLGINGANETEADGDTQKFEQPTFKIETQVDEQLVVACELLIKNKANNDLSKFDSTLSSIYQLAESLLQSDQFGTSEKLLDILLNAHSDLDWWGKVVFLRMVIYFKQKRYYLVISNGLEILTKKPKSVAVIEVYYLVGRSFKAIDEKNKALDYLGKAAKIDARYKDVGQILKDIKFKK